MDRSGNTSLGENGITLLPDKFKVANIKAYSQITFSTSQGIGYYTLKGEAIVEVLGVMVKGDVELTYEQDKRTYTFILHPLDGNVPTSLVYAAVTNKPQATFESISDTLVKSNFSARLALVVVVVSISTCAPRGTSPHGPAITVGMNGIATVRLCA